MIRKIASIGVHARDWVTWHGFALNVTTDLSYFQLMIPCGIDGVQMTSIAEELDRRAISPDVRAVGREVARAFGVAFALDPIEVDPDTLRELSGVDRESFLA